MRVDVLDISSSFLTGMLSCLGFPTDRSMASTKNARILLVNPLQSSRSTFSRGSLRSFFAFKAGMLGTPISALGGWPTVSGD